MGKKDHHVYAVNLGLQFGPEDFAALEAEFTEALKCDVALDECERKWINKALFDAAAVGLTIGNSATKDDADPLLNKLSRSARKFAEALEQINNPTNPAGRRARDILLSAVGSEPYGDGSALDVDPSLANRVRELAGRIEDHREPCGRRMEHGPLRELIHLYEMIARRPLGRSSENSATGTLDGPAFRFMRAFLDALDKKLGEVKHARILDATLHHLIRGYVESLPPNSEGK